MPGSWLGPSWKMWKARGGGAGSPAALARIPVAGDLGSGGAEKVPRVSVARSSPLSICGRGEGAKAAAKAHQFQIAKDHELLSRISGVAHPPQER